MNQLLKIEFDTNIGLIKCELFSNKSDFASIQEQEYKNGKSKIYQNAENQIEFKSKTHTSVKDSKS